MRTVLMAALICAPALAGERTLRCEAVVDAPVAKVWEAFTTKSGVESWMVPVAEIDLRVGGTLKTNYNKEAGVGGPGTIVHHILAYEPERMFAARFDVPAENSPLKLAEKTWWVVRLEPIDSGHTHVWHSMVGFGEGPEWDDVYAKFEKGNNWTMQQLVKKFAPAEPQAAAGSPAVAIDSALFVSGGPDVRRFVIEEHVDAAPEDVFKAYTTSEGWKSRLGVESKIDLRIGGPFEIYFSMTPPPGERGSEGCQVLAYEPGESVTYSWNAPPKFAMARTKRTWVQFSVREDSKGGTLVRLVHAGFGAGEEWDQVYEYFKNAWPRVLGGFRESFKK